MPFSSFTGISEFVLDAKGCWGSAQHRADISTRDALGPLPTPASRVDPFPAAVPTPFEILLRCTSTVVRRLSGISNRRRCSGESFGPPPKRVLSTEPWHMAARSFLTVPNRLTHKEYPWPELLSSAVCAKLEERQCDARFRYLPLGSRCTRAARDGRRDRLGNDEGSALQEPAG